MWPKLDQTRLLGLEFQPELAYVPSVLEAEHNIIGKADDHHIPTKPEIALALLDQVQAWGVPHWRVVADADDSDSPHFLAGLEVRQERYVVAVRTDFQVRVG